MAVTENLSEAGLCLVQLVPILVVLNNAPLTLPASIVFPVGSFKSNTTLLTLPPKFVGPCNT